MNNSINNNFLNNQENVANQQPSPNQTQPAPKLDNSQLNSAVFGNQQPNQPQQVEVNNSPSIFKPLTKEKPDIIIQVANLTQQMENLKQQNERLLSELNASKQAKSESVKEQVQSPSNTLTETDFLNKLKEFKSKNEKLIDMHIQERLRDMQIEQIISETNQVLVNNYKGTDSKLLSAFYEHVKENYGEAFFKNIKPEAIKNIITLLYDKFYKDIVYTKDGNGHTIPQDNKPSQIINSQPQEDNEISAANQSFQDILTTKRILQTTLLASLQATRRSGYRQVFDNVVLPSYSGWLEAKLVGFKGGLSDTNTFWINPDTYEDAKNEQASDLCISLGYFGDFVKVQRHNVESPLSDIIDIQNEKQLQQQAAKVLDNVAGEALYRGGNLFISGAYNPEAKDGKTVTLLTAYPTDATKIGPLSVDLLNLSAKQFRNTKFSMAKLNDKADGTTEITQVQVNIPIPKQSGTNAYTLLISEDLANQLYQDPRLVNVYVVNGSAYQVDFFNRTLFNDGVKFFNFQIKIIDNPVTLDLPTTAGQPATLNFNGTGALEFATLIGGVTTGESCKEVTFTDGINWEIVPFGSNLGDVFASTYISGWHAFYGASVIDTSKVINIVCNRNYYNPLSTGTPVTTNIVLNKPHK